MKIFGLLILATSITLASDWNFTPHIYSRGGITMNASLSKKGASKEAFNLGSWGDASHTINNPLTELTLEANYKKELKYTYGVDVDNNERYYEGTATALNERLNFIEFYQNSYSLWFGNRAYRGVGDYLTAGFPLDDHNMLGGGVRIPKVGPFNIEFACGVKEETAPYNRNILINKIEYPLSNGMIKTNVELHQINSDKKHNAYIAGMQFQRWGDKVLSGNLYNILVLNYSLGNIYGGGMQSAYTANYPGSDIAKDSSKVVIKWGGDWKSSDYALYYTFKYQLHKGKESYQKWSFVDSYLRPLMVLTSNVTVGFDIAHREIIDENKDSGLNWGSSLYGANRTAVMFAYNLKNKSFGNPSISLFIGAMGKEKNTTFFSGGQSKKDDHFVRLNYEISI